MYCSHSLEELILNDSNDRLLTDKSIEIYLLSGMALSKTKHGFGFSEDKKERKSSDFILSNKYSNIVIYSMTTLL